MAEMIELTRFVLEEIPIRRLRPGHMMFNHRAARVPGVPLFREVAHVTPGPMRSGRVEFTDGTAVEMTGDPLIADPLHVPF